MFRTLEKREDEFHYDPNHRNSNLSYQRDSPSPRNLPASSLVQMWEARLNQHPSQLATLRRSRSLHVTGTKPIVNEKPFSGLAASYNLNNTDHHGVANIIVKAKDDSCLSSSSSCEDFWDDSAAAPLPSPKRNSSHTKEIEKLRVSEIIRRWTSESHHDSGEKQRAGGNDTTSKSSGRMEPERPQGMMISSNAAAEQQGQQTGSLPLPASRPFIRFRGRQFDGFLFQMEKERYKEVDSIAQRHLVSMFPHRSRIQALLKMRFIRKDTPIEKQPRGQPQSFQTITPKPHRGSILPYPRMINETGGHATIAPIDETTSRTDTENSSMRRIGLAPPDCNPLTLGSNGHQDITVGKESSEPQSTSEKDEIGRLRERRRLTWLSSDVRKRMEEPSMMSHTRVPVMHQDKGDLNNVDNQQVMVQSKLPYFRSHSDAAHVQGQVLQEHEFVEVGEDALQPRHSQAQKQEQQGEEEEQPLGRSWNHNNQNEAFEGEKKVPSTPAELSHPDNQIPSSIDHLANEVELIHDLKGQMRQLQRDVMKLRGSIQSCMSMQAQLQSCSNIGPARSDGKNPNDGSQRKSFCCICRKMQVDSFLYRCGHMFTCLKCAQELQSYNGKCLICEAPILDVVPAALDF